MLKQGLKSLQLASALNKYRKAEASQKDIAAQYLYYLMGKEKGLFLKLGQLMGNSLEAKNEFKSLNANDFPAVPFSDIEQVLHENYPNLKETFQDISTDAIPASLAQVHKAQLSNGEEVAIKVQYPFIEKEIHEQLKLMGLLPHLANLGGPPKKWGIPVKDYLKTLRDCLEDELNYKHECQNLRKMSSINFPKGIIVPKLYDEFTREKVYVQSWENGVKFEEVVNHWQEKDRIEAAKLLVDCFMHQLFCNGFIQTDPNDGNYLFRKGANGVELILLDFGNCLNLPSNFRFSLMKLIQSIIDKSPVDPFPYLLMLGFDAKKLQHIRPSLAQLMMTIFENFYKNSPYDLTNLKLGDRVDKILGESKWWFRSAGSPHFLLLMKAYTGLIQQIIRLNIKINWQGTFINISKNYRDIIDNFKSHHKEDPRYSFEALAKDIVIHVRENHKDKVKVKIPVKALVDLDDYIEEDIRKKLQNRGINTKEIILNAIKNGAYPQDLFELEDAGKKYHIYLQ